MNLQNGYKVIYEKIADGKRTFFADKMDGTEADQIGEAVEIGKYKLVFEKDGKIYGSESGKTEDGVCLEAFNEVFVKTNTEETQEPANEQSQEPEQQKAGNEEEEPEVKPAADDAEEPDAKPQEEE
jgi:hypothetical protein